MSSIGTAKAVIKYYSDKDGNKGITKVATVTTKLLKSPQIGDTSHLSMWITLLFISGGAVIGTAVTEKKKAEMKPEYRHTYGPGAAVCAFLVL